MDGMDEMDPMDRALPGAFGGVHSVHKVLSVHFVHHSCPFPLSKASALAGKSVMMPAAPSAARRSMSSGRFTV